MSFITHYDQKLVLAQPTVYGLPPALPDGLLQHYLRQKSNIVRSSVHKEVKYWLLTALQSPILTCVTFTAAEISQRCCQAET